MPGTLAFIKKVLFDDVLPKFAVVKGQFINEADSYTSSPKSVKSHLTKYIQDLYNLSMPRNDF